MEESGGEGRVCLSASDHDKTGHDRLWCTLVLNSRINLSALVNLIIQLIFLITTCTVTFYLISVCTITRSKLLPAGDITCCAKQFTMITQITHDYLFLNFQAYFIVDYVYHRRRHERFRLLTCITWQFPP